MLGAPGVGKGTQAKRIQEEHGVPQISTGDLLRDAVEKSTELGKKAVGYMNRGELVPDEIMIDLIRERVSQAGCQRGFVLDGFPRTVRQAVGLEGLLRSLGLRLDSVISLEAESEVLVQRLLARRVCRSCGADYNVVTHPSKQEGVCDLCGGEVVRRPDDNEETIRNRLEVYQRQTAPVKDFYAERRQLGLVDGRGSVDDVFARVEDALDG